jgi:hypothetical protein
LFVLSVFLSGAAPPHKNCSAHAEQATDLDPRGALGQKTVMASDISHWSLPT